MNKEQIIERFSDQFGYVADIEGVFSYLKDNKLSLEETNQILFAIFEWNQQVTSKLQTKNPVWKKKEKIEKRKEEVEEKEDFSPAISPQAQLYDVKQYMNAISNCSDLDFITDILPSPYDSHYDDIILSIILKLYQEISFATQEISTSQEEEERQYFLEERARDHQIIHFIQSYNEEEEKEVEEEETSLEVENQLVYLTNLNRVPYILGDIEDIHSEDYSTTLKLIQKLRKGILWKEKRFSNSAELTEISALRYHDSRVIFTRVAPNTILVLGIFTKRLQNTAWYQDFLRNRAGMYRSQKEEIVGLAKEEAYRKENEEITSCVFNKLTSRSEKRKMRGEN